MSENLEVNKPNHVISSIGIYTLLLNHDIRRNPRRPHASLLLLIVYFKYLSFILLIHYIQQLPLSLFWSNLHSLLKDLSELLLSLWIRSSLLSYCLSFILSTCLSFCLFTTYNYPLSLYFGPSFTLFLRISLSYFYPCGFHPKVLLRYNVHL